MISTSREEKRRIAGERSAEARPTRAWLAEVLLRSLDELSEEEVEALWLDEAERRERAWDAGEVEAIPAEQVMRELRSDSD